MSDLIRIPEGEHLSARESVFGKFDGPALNAHERAELLNVIWADGQSWLVPLLEEIFRGNYRCDHGVVAVPHLLRVECVRDSVNGPTRLRIWIEGLKEPREIETHALPLWLKNFNWGLPLRWVVESLAIRELERMDLVQQLYAGVTDGPQRLRKISGSILTQATKQASKQQDPDFGMLAKPIWSALGLDAEGLKLAAVEASRTRGRPNRIERLKEIAPILMGAVMEQRRQWLQVYAAALETGYVQEQTEAVDVTHLMQNVLVDEFDVPVSGFELLVEITEGLGNRYWFSSIYGELPVADFIPTLSLVVRFLSGDDESMMAARALERVRDIDHRWLVWRLWALAREVGFDDAHAIVGKLSGWLYAESQADLSTDCRDNLSEIYKFHDWKPFLASCRIDVMENRPNDVGPSGFAQAWQRDLHRWVARLTILRQSWPSEFDACGRPTVPLLERVALDDQHSELQEGIGPLCAFLPHYRDMNVIGRSLVCEADHEYEVDHKLMFDVDLLDDEGSFPSRVCLELDFDGDSRLLPWVHGLHRIDGIWVDEMPSEQRAKALRLFTPIVDAWNLSVLAQFHGALSPSVVR